MFSKRPEQFDSKQESREQETRRYWPSSMQDERRVDAGRQGMSVYADDVGMYEMGFGFSAGGGEA